MTTYEIYRAKQKRRKAVERVASILSRLFLIGLFVFAMWQMLQAQDEGNWAKATFWLVALLGVSLERKVVSIMEDLDEIKWRP